MLTRERVITAALKLFYERGTFGAGMRDLAQAADISVQGIYYHFGSKQELVRAALAEARRKSIGPEPVLPRGLVGRFEAQAYAEFDGFIANSELRGLLAMEAVRRQPDAIVAVMAQYDDWSQRWAEIVLGEAEDVDPAADLHGAASVITTFLWGLNITFVITLDVTLRRRIPQISRYLEATLVKREAD